MITPDRLIVAGVAFFKSIHEIRILKFEGISIISPDERLSFLVLSRTLLRFYTHCEYTEPLKIINEFLKD